MHKECVTFNFLREEHAKCHNLYLLQDDKTAGKGEGGTGMTSKHTLNNWLSLQSTRQLGNIPMIVEICYHISNLDVSIKRHKLGNNTHLWNKHSLQENGTLEKKKKDKQREDSLRQTRHVSKN